MQYQYWTQSAYDSPLTISAGDSYTTPSTAFEVDNRSHIAVEISGTASGAATVTVDLTGSIDGSAFETNQNNTQQLANVQLTLAGTGSSERGITLVDVRGLRAVRVERVAVATNDVSDIIIMFGRQL